MAGTMKGWLLLVSLLAMPWLHAEEAPMLAEQPVSEHYQLIKVAERTNVGLFDTDLDEYLIDLWALIHEEQQDVPGVVRARIKELAELDRDAFIFKNAIPVEYYFSDYWTGDDSLLRIVDYRKTEKQYDLNTYLGPISRIATSWRGVATFHLRFDGEVVVFQSHAMKKRFSLRDQFDAYFMVYLPAPEVAERMKMLVLVANNANDWLDDNGVYLLIPR